MSWYMLVTIALLSSPLYTSAALTEGDPVCSDCAKSTVCPLVAFHKFIKSDHACAELDATAGATVASWGANPDCPVDDPLVEFACHNSMISTDQAVRSRLASQGKAKPTATDCNDSPFPACRSWCYEVYDSHAACFPGESRESVCGSYPISSCWTRADLVIKASKTPAQITGSYLNANYECKTCQGYGTDRKGDSCHYIDEGYRLQPPGGCGVLESQMDILDQRLFLVAPTCDVQIQLVRHYMCWDTFIAQDDVIRNQLGANTPQCRAWQKPCQQWCTKVYNTHPQCFRNLGNGNQLTLEEACGSLPTSACFTQAEANELSQINSAARVGGPLALILTLVLMAIWGA